MRKVAFEPIVDEKSSLLLLGTMPGIKSLEKAEYYGHPQNQFWRLLFAVFGVESITDYNKKKEFLLNYKIALWDVLASCENKSSLDSDIRNEVVNDFEAFFNKFPKIHTVVFDSLHAEKFYNKYVKNDFGKNFYRIPSPSGANARMSFDVKLNEWKNLLVWLKNKKSV